MEEELQIGSDVVVDPERRLEAREVEAAEPADQRREGARERLRLAREIEKDESLPRLERHPVQGVVAFLEPSDLAHVRRADQLAVDGVGPGVVGALDRFGESPIGLPGACAAEAATRHCRQTGVRTPLDTPVLGHGRAAASAATSAEPRLQSRAPLANATPRRSRPSIATTAPSANTVAAEKAIDRA